MTKRVLVSLAHPDDESFGSGPLIAKLVAEGAEVTLICTTNGDVGSAAEEHLKGYGSVAEMRLAELDCAAKVLGLKEVVLFGYRDSGMMGSADNSDPKSLWQAPLDEVADRIVEVMRRVHPHVIFTFDPYGGYGHPDHIKTHKATLAAFRKVQADSVHPQKVYYGGFPKRLMWLYLMWMRMRGKDPRKSGLNGDMDYQAVYDNILPTNTQLDVSKYLEIGDKAAQCHSSQLGGFVRRANPIVDFFTRRMLGIAWLTRAYPEPKPGEPLERDIFAGINTQQ
jgi:LmbE family N-acetylglucosaminyl deacetylase